MGDAEFEELDLGQLLREGDIARFNAIRKVHSFKRIDLTRQQLVFADMSGAVLMEADLAESSLSGAVLTGANLRSAYLMTCDLTGAEMSEADFTAADMSGSDLTGAVLTRSDLTEANLSGAKLCGANLAGANLRYIDLRRADLRKAIFSGARLLGANLDDVRADLPDLRNLGESFETDADVSMKLGNFSDAMQLYDEADRFFGLSYSFDKRIELFRKMARLGEALSLTPPEIEQRARRIVLSLRMVEKQALDQKRVELSSRAGNLARSLSREFSLDGEPSEPHPRAEGEPEPRLTRPELSRFATMALRYFRRFDQKQLAIRLGELVESLDDSTVLDLTVRFSIPDLRVEKSPQPGSEDFGTSIDELRGKTLMEVVSRRLREELCQEHGPVHKAWIRGDERALLAVIGLLHEELKLSPPYDAIVSLLAAAMVKGGLSDLCGWSPLEQQVSLG